MSEERFRGRAHVLWSQGSKSKRISYSTSHGETLAAINGMETESLVSLRISELILPDKKPSLQQLAALQERGNENLPIDHHTDCRGLFEVVTGSKTLPQDKAQRIYTLALKEARLCGRIRWFLLIPTQWMTADPLTKPMHSGPLLHLLSSGIVPFDNEGKHIICGRCLPRLEIDDETNLEYEDKQIVHALLLATHCVAAKGCRPIFFALLCCFLLPVATSSSTASGFSDRSCAAPSHELADQGWSSFFVLFMMFISGTFLFCFSYAAVG
jgi:hypothetical protein